MDSRQVHKTNVCVDRPCDSLLTLAPCTQASVNLATGQARVVTVAHGRSAPTHTELAKAVETAGFPARDGWDTISKGTSVVLDVQGLKVCCEMTPNTERRSINLVLKGKVPEPIYQEGKVGPSPYTAVVTVKTYPN